MNSKKLWTVIGLIVVILAAAQAVYARFTADDQALDSSTCLNQTDSGGIDYTVKELPNGSLKVSVHVNWTDPETLNRYIQANRERALACLRAGGMDWIPVTVTFVRPLSWREVTVLRQATGLVVENYTFVATYENGRKAMIGGVADENSLVDIDKLAEIAKQQGVMVKGVMVLKGKVKNTSTGLGTLIDDERVYLADVVAVEVMEDLKGNPLYRDAKYIDVFVPSPYWDMGWD
jgi:hypothetical protein